MGWTDSPAFFCAASETARDVADASTQQPIGSLPPHPLEHLLLPPDKWEQADAMSPDGTASCIDDFVHLLECYVDDFITLAQTTDTTVLLHLSRALLEAIHAVFPPGRVTGNVDDEPISLKKLHQGDGLWETRKELLGWIFDGVRRCIQLPEQKVTSLLKELHQAVRSKAMPYKAFEKLRGRLRHACIGIPAGKGLMGPIDNALAKGRGFIAIKKNPSLRTALSDFHTIIKMMNKQPTFC